MGMIISVDVHHFNKLCATVDKDKKVKYIKTTFINNRNRNFGHGKISLHSQITRNGIKIDSIK